MDRLRILIADSDTDFQNALSQLLQSSYLTRTADDGIQALQLLHSFLPDIFVLDLMLPGLDGITLLQKAAESGICPKVLATTRYISDYILDAVQQLGVGYVIVKPCDVNATALRIADLSQRIQPPIFSQPDTKTLISNTLLRLGISTKLRGYGYLREAVLLMAYKPDQSITKELYPAVASRFNASAIQIERSIRSAIAAAWAHMDHSLWQNYFPPDNTGCISRPTNAAFISRLADRLILDEELTLPE